MLPTSSITPQTPDTRTHVPDAAAIPASLCPYLHHVLCYFKFSPPVLGLILNICRPVMEACNTCSPYVSIVILIETFDLIA